MKVALISVISVTVLVVLIATQGIAESGTKTAKTTSLSTPSVIKKKHKHDLAFRKKATKIAATVVATWTCESQRGVSRTPFTAAEDPWSLPRSFRIREKVLNQWILRRKACIKALHAHDDVLRRLRRGLSGTPMAGSEKELEAAGRLYKISPYFIAAIAGTESSFGLAACRDAKGNRTLNYWGLSSCGSGWHVPQFSTLAEAYMFMGRFLTSRWPDAVTTYDYHGYAANSQSWGAKNEYWMHVKFGVTHHVRYLSS